MNLCLRPSLARLAPIVGPSVWISLLAALLLLAGCGAENKPAGQIGLYSPGSKTDEEWALWFLEHDHVVLHPGYLYDFPEVRVRPASPLLIASLLVPPDIFQQAINQISV